MVKAFEQSTAGSKSINIYITQKFLLNCFMVCLLYFLVKIFLKKNVDSAFQLVTLYTCDS